MGETAKKNAHRRAAGSRQAACPTSRRRAARSASHASCGASDAPPAQRVGALRGAATAMTSRPRGARPCSSCSTRWRADCAWRGRCLRFTRSLLVPSTEPSTEPITFGDGPAPGCPCKCTPMSPAACLTTRPPRCEWFGWSDRPWGWLSISRGNPGPGVVSRSVVGASERRNVRKEKLQNSNQDEARTRGLRLGECACRRKVIASAIEERCAFCASNGAAARAGARSSADGGGRGGRSCARRMIASTTVACCACCSYVGVRATAGARRR